MAKCVACEDEIEDEAELATAACEHEFHQDCLNQNLQQGLQCQGCYPPGPMPEYRPAQATVDQTLDDSDDESGYVTADESFDDTDDETTPGDTTPTVAPTTVATTPTLEETQAAAAQRLRVALDRADTAVAAANRSIEGLARAGATRATVIGAVETDGFTDALAGCASTGDWRPSAEGAEKWPATQELIDDLNGAAASFETNATVIESGQTSLNAMAAVDVGPKVALAGIAEHNVADMALTGPSFQGYHLHELTRELRGWSSIRAEGPFVVIVRWSGTKLQVGATGKHIQLSGGDSYELDDTLATTFATKLACKRADGSYEIV